MNRLPVSFVQILVVIAFAGLRTPLPAQRPAVEAAQGMVVAAHFLASEAGVEILKKGGNAVDAAVATGLALAVVYPSAGNLGGGGFMLIHLAAGRDLVIDYRETAPAGATRDMYLGPDGKPLAGPGSSTVGWRASGVPGTVAGFALALEKFGSGRISWSDAIEPARRLAANGHTVSQATARSLREEAKLLGQFEETKRIHLNGGAFWRAGDLWRQPDLAATLARLQQGGPREFYEGETAARIAAAMEKNNGTITRADLADYRPVERMPLRGTYRGHQIVTMPPPSSGGLALLQMLAMLEPHGVAALGCHSAAKYHLFAEAMRRAFRDRAEYLGDPDHINVPVVPLLDRGYLRRRMGDFDARRATPSTTVQPGLGPMILKPIVIGRPESRETTHYSVVDAAGNAVANTYTLNGGYGSGVTVPGTGILLNNEMDDFTCVPGVPNLYGLIQGEANVVAPGRRPLSSMTPTMFFKDGKLLLVTGSPGGPTIINTVLQIVTNTIDFGMPAAQAVEAPRIHHQWMPDEITHERFGMSGDTAGALRAMGHTVRELRQDEYYYQGDGATIAVDAGTGLRLGAADPRRADARAVGY